MLSSTKAVSGISRFATNLLRFENDGVDEEEEEEEEEGEDGDEVAGVTDEVLDFVEEISSRPECWTDFPLSLDDGKPNYAYIHSHIRIPLCEIYSVRYCI